MARHPELLIPASSLEVLKTAVMFGADAVYIGGEAFGLRAKAKNFSMEEMKEGIAFAHEHDVKVYVTANILAHNEDLSGVREYFKELKEIKPDALIIADPGVFEIAKEICPEIERHISTQANNTNYATYKFGQIFRMSWKLRHLSMGRCAFLIPEDACSATISPEEMQTGEHVPIHADGNILWLRKPDQENICRYMKMREELIFLTPRTSV